MIDMEQIARRVVACEGWSLGQVTGFYWVA